MGGGKGFAGGGGFERIVEICGKGQKPHVQSRHMGHPATARNAKEVYDASTYAKGESTMADTHNVFISWSGERSRLAAEALKGWLGTVLQNARPWMSTEIEKGSRSYEEIARALEGMKVGIICLTPENLTSEWLHFEAGALSKTLDPKTRVCTYLLADLESSTLKAPLAWFQWTRANKADTRKLIGTINKHLDATQVPEDKLDTIFEKMWPDLEQKLKALPIPSTAPPPRRGLDEIAADTLALVRSIVPAILETARETAIVREKRELDEQIRQAILNTNTLVTVSGASGGNLSPWLTVNAGTGEAASFRNFIIHDAKALPPELEVQEAEPPASPTDPTPKLKK